MSKYHNYPVVTIDSPFLNIYIKGVLEDIVTVGPTLVYVRRVGESVDFASYAPLEEVGNRLLVAFDAQLFAMPGGRYTARLVYKGTELGEVEFVFDKTAVTLVGSDNV